MKGIGKSSSMITLVAALVLLSMTSGVAGTYDDFKGTGVDSGKWVVDGNGYSQPGDGFLYFASTGPTLHSLTSKDLFPSGVFTISFQDYACNNRALSGNGLGSILGMGIGFRKGNNWVRIERGQAQLKSKHPILANYIEVNWVDPNEAGNPVHLNWINAGAGAGQLQIRYDGKEVTFFYRASATDEWTQMMKTDRERGRPDFVNGQPQPLVLNPGWTSPVPLFIHAYPGGNGWDGYSLLFKLKGVDVDPVLGAPTGK